MIKKHRSKPIIIYKLKSLLKRMTHSELKIEDIQNALRKYESGYRGEQSMDYFYRYLPQNNLYFLHGIRISHHDYFFQMDTLIITPNFLLIIESKNIAGHLYFESSYDGMIRTLNNQRDSFDNPVEQVKRQSFHLMHLLQKLKITDLPIESLVVMTNSKAITEFSSTYKEARSKVIKSSGLMSKFEELSNKNIKEILQSNEMKRLIKYLIKQHTPDEPDVCSTFQIDRSSLLRGVFCPSCETEILKRVKRSWYCFTCKSYYNKAHEAALVDYALLISSSISNQSCKQFLNLSTNDQAYYLLRTLNLPFTGNRKSRIYHLDNLVKKTTSKEEASP
ncbi:nuclease-related domain-containing protein [Fictibacillus sp. 18YEL24]|uniref:nuclease-related domain-containing protein n=1 Tax=Fictibacillus sp. 18YEL24 TaxID=2745875 RepID=UPI0018CCDF7B|nr:nuclease-related domain-containing protein [Fictibacillus sp. 18YEL24]MBH0169405.1 NERD domain-containing protein [Fictibacillus sp. 18YEL24]